MTSNQLQYWRTEEEKRANKQNEALKSKELEEKERHNVTQEQLEEVSQALKAREIDVKDKQLLADLAEWYTEYGVSSMKALPVELREKLESEYGVPLTHTVADKYDNETLKYVTNIWEEIKRVFKGAGREIVKALF